MSSFLKTILQVVTYTLTILGVMFLSSEFSEPNLYDPFKVSLDGVLLPVTDKDRSVQFYKGVLELSPIRISKTDKQLVGFILPDSRKLLVEEGNQDVKPASVIMRCKVAWKNFMLKLSDAWQVLHNRRDY